MSVTRGRPPAVLSLRGDGVPALSRRPHRPWACTVLSWRSGYRVSSHQGHGHRPRALSAVRQSGSELRFSGQSLALPARLRGELLPGLGQCALRSATRLPRSELGAGTFPRIASRVAPEVSLHSVEIDPVVVDIARKYFFYQESDRLTTTVEDGRVFLSRPGPAYDLIVLDAFNAQGVPFHLTTREFFEVVRQRLAPEGVFAANFIGALMGKDARLFSGQLPHDPETVRSGLPLEPRGGERPPFFRGQSHSPGDRLCRTYRRGGLPQERARACSPMGAPQPPNPVRRRLFTVLIRRPAFRS